MERFCREVPGWRMANMVEDGMTPLLPQERLGQIGYRIAAYPLTLLSCAVHAMRVALTELKAGQSPSYRVDFETLRDIVGFNAYDDLLAEYERESKP